MRVLARGRAVVSGIAALCMLAAGCGGSSSGTGSDAAGSCNGGTLRVGYLDAQAAAGFLRMAEHKDLYKKYGVTVKPTTLANASEVTPSLISHSVDMIEESPGAVMIAISQGVLQAKIVGSPMPGLPWAIYGGKNITSLDQLNGKSMGVSSATGLPRVVADLILRKHGVDPNSVKYVNGGANADRYKQVVTGTVDSASIPSDFVPNAQADGLHILALAADEVPQYPRFTNVVRDDYLKSNAACVSAYLAAQIEGERYAFDHPDEAKQISAEALGGNTTPTSPTVTSMYQQIVSGNLVNKDDSIPRADLDFLQNTLVQTGQLNQPVDLNKIYDDQYRQQALKLVNDKQPGS